MGIRWRIKPRLLELVTDFFSRLLAVMIQRLDRPPADPDTDDTFDPTMLDSRLYLPPVPHFELAPNAERAPMLDNEGNAIIPAYGERGVPLLGHRAGRYMDIERELAQTLATKYPRNLRRTIHQDPELDLPPDPPGDKITETRIVERRIIPNLSLIHISEPTRPY